MNRTCKKVDKRRKARRTCKIIGVFKLSVRVLNCNFPGGKLNGRILSEKLDRSPSPKKSQYLEESDMILKCHREAKKTQTDLLIRTETKRLNRKMNSPLVNTIQTEQLGLVQNASKTAYPQSPKFGLPTDNYEREVEPT